MKLLLIFFVFTVCAFAEKEANIVTPKVGERFGKVMHVSLEFVDKQNTYYAKVLVKEKWMAKVISVNGVKLPKPVFIEYFFPEGDARKGKIYHLLAYKDIKSFGVNKELSGELQKVSYGIRQFLWLREPFKKKSDAKAQF